MGRRTRRTTLELKFARKARQVEIYRQGKAIELLKNPERLSGEDIFPKLVLDLESSW
jgi:Uma2 family endonuclease